MHTVLVLGSTSCSNCYDRGRKVLIRNEILLYILTTQFFFFFHLIFQVFLLYSFTHKTFAVNSSATKNAAIYLCIWCSFSAFYGIFFSLCLHVFIQHFVFFLNSFCIETLQPVQMHVNFNTRIKKNSLRETNVQKHREKKNCFLQ